MNKFAYLAALAAVPAMVAPSQAAPSATADQKVAVCKAACCMIFLHTVVDDSASASKKAETIETLAEGLENVNRVGVPDDLFDSSVEIVSGMDDEILENLGDYMVAALAILEENNYYGSTRLKKATERFFTALLAD